MEKTHGWVQPSSGQRGAVSGHWCTFQVRIVLLHSNRHLDKPLLDHHPWDRFIFAQAHEAVGAPCIMVRQGQYKYNYIHGYDPQFFDLTADPGEWHNLAGSTDHAETEARLRGLVLDHFDPEAIARDNLDSLYRRELINETMQKNGVYWDHATDFNPRKGALDQYLS